MPIYIKGAKSILFIHVPKTGGTSIEGLLRASGYEQHDHDGQGGDFAANKLRHCPPQHWHAAQLNAAYRIEAFTAVFMLVRDPLDRVRSEFAYRLAWRDREVSEEGVLKWWGTVEHRYSRNAFVMDNHIRPQSEFWLPEAQVYRFEDGLDSVARDLNDRLNLELVTEVPHRKASSSRNGGVSSSQVPVSDSFRRRVEEFYHKDYERFGYPLSE